VAWATKEKASAWRREWRKLPHVKAKRTEEGRKYRKTPRSKFCSARTDARRRGIDWQLSFEDWYDIWISSGHWDQRGVSGYQMCRYGDEGPYIKENVYIATQAVNKQDAYRNGKVKTPAERGFSNKKRAA
jgi:hypothetical protein